MKYNLASIMRRAWGLRREKGYTMTTALRLAWMEAKVGDRPFRAD